MLVRVGIPASFQRFSAAAVEMGAPILVSANALRRRAGGFREPPPDLFCYADAALDSAGFVAMVKYGGFPWSVEDYVSLAGAHPWAWWASMDLCCEPQVAKDRDEVWRRQDRTVELLEECRAEALAQGVKPPMPVLQGWTAEDYLRCVDLMGDLPDLVGLGSVCRRNVHGDDGLIRIVAALDDALPPHVKLHLFGVKGPAIPHLQNHMLRIKSTDSMGWDFTARRQLQAGDTYNIDYRSRHLRKWYRAQRARVDSTLGVFA